MPRTEHYGNQEFGPREKQRRNLIFYLPDGFSYKNKIFFCVGHTVFYCQNKHNTN